MTDTRLIEHAFPLKQASLDSVHEKNVRHGHISTLHIWPARRPLAACRAALIATLLPDPGTEKKRKELCEKIGGKIVKKVQRKKMPGGATVDHEVEATEGGILHWGRETENKADFDWFRNEIKKAYGGKPPKVLDPFAGGGAIPLEAMRLGCEATAVDINPVAWFILKCTLEYPQKLAGKTLPLPDFILEDEDFMKAFYKAHKQSVSVGEDEAAFDKTKTPPQADLAWHVRAWGRWVLEHARQELAEFYPLVDDKPTVAYLWARTVTCKNCRATVPLLKTRWLCKKEKKRVILTMEPNSDQTGVVFGIDSDVPPRKGNAAQNREHDKKISAGTMSRSGATCPCCNVTMTMEDIRTEGKAGRLGAVMTAVVVDGQNGKEYRLPTEYEIQKTEDAEKHLDELFAQIPFGLPDEPMPTADALGFRAPLYGFDKWRKLFTSRQLLAIGTFVKWTRAVGEAMSNTPSLSATPYTNEWKEAVQWLLGCVLGRAINYMSTLCIWEPIAAEVKQTFLRFALPITWDYAEGNPLSDVDRYYRGGISNVAKFLDCNMHLSENMPSPHVVAGSATLPRSNDLDLIITDPPYYDAIPYSDLMDFFYIWLKRIFAGLSSDENNVFNQDLSPKWDHEANDGELIDDASRHGGDRKKSKQAYEDGMSQVCRRCYDALSDSGRLVIVFANKSPDAWETLVSAIIRAGFVVTASWPIATEMQGGVRNYGRASLASSIWLVCRKRSDNAVAGWDNAVLSAMREKIAERLRTYWDAGIRGPDFVWAATGPAMEAFSKHPVVKKANESGIMTVREFLDHVRRLVVEFVVGRVLSGDEKDAAALEPLDDPTAYYLLHRHDFGMDDAPAGACILYALSCGISDRDLASVWNLISFGSSQTSDDEEENEDDGDVVATESKSGSKVKLKTWQQRKSKSLGIEAAGGRAVPLIDRVHGLMHIWKAGERSAVDRFLDEHGLRRSELFRRLLQSLIELALPGSDERAVLESISNHVGVIAPRNIQKTLKI
jgi:adenine-specific DNA methylase